MRFSSNPLWKYILVLAGVYVYILGWLLNYENAWMHPEVVNITHSILNEHATTAERLYQGLNWGLMEDAGKFAPASRPRFFSYLFLTVNIVFRNWLFQFTPPHPSLSITWLIVLILSPILMYRLVMNLIANKETAFMAVILYLSLPGTLIPIMMLFHPGKVFTNFFFIFCLYLASEIKKLQNPDPGKREKNFILYTLLILAIFTSLFFDEYSLFIFILVPLFFPEIFSVPKHSLAAAWYLSIPLFYVIIILLVLPWLYAAAGFPGFNFLNYTDINKNPPAFSLYNTLVNFVLLLQDNLRAGFGAYLKNNDIGLHITHYGSVANRIVPADNIHFGLNLLNENLDGFEVLHNFLFFAVILLFISSFFKTPPDPPLNRHIVRSFIALLLFTLFFSLLHIPNAILSGCAWYGCSFSVLFALLCALILHKAAKLSPWAKTLTTIFLVSLVINSLTNTKILNTTWMLINRRTEIQLDVWLNRIPRKELYNAYRDQRKTSNFEMTYWAWKNRHDRKTAGEFLKKASLETRYYLYRELPHIK